MRLFDGAHLTYCTNIHAGEDWPGLFKALQAFLPELKSRLSPDGVMGVGLRLGARTARELLAADQLETFSTWLEAEGLYVFTLNGFPYGNFHGTAVKDRVHEPDWSRPERLDYTLQLGQILARLLPDGMDGGISTSPLSYRHWHKPAKHKAFLRQASRNLLQTVSFLRNLEERTGRYIHLDIEPEPDGMLETTEDVLRFYQDVLLPEAETFFPTASSRQAQAWVFRYLCLCYDVCHMAVAFESQAEALEKLGQAGIRIGKFQLSSALEAGPDQDPTALLAWDEPTYLHQVVGRDSDGLLHRFRDLKEAEPAFRTADAHHTWRSHFHVPVFLNDLDALRTTQADLAEVLALQRKQGFTRHLEVETYTWDVLPSAYKTDLLTSVARELEWVKERYEKDRST